MSKIGKKPIVVPAGVAAEKTASGVNIKGPKGALSVGVSSDFDVRITDKEVKISPKGKSRGTFALWGTQRALLQNAVSGVHGGFEKRLIIEGIGYGAQIQGKTLLLKIGHTHPVALEIPEGLQANVAKNVIHISGIDKAQVGQFAAHVKKQKPPEPYKGKGIRYEGEVIRRKAGKKVAGTTA